MSVTAPDSTELLCPSCGFDLRGTPGDRCGECGLILDRTAMQTSGFPWAHRREIGRVRAYLKTFWFVTFRPSKLRNETARPQDFYEARRFARVTAWLVALSLLGLFALVVWEEKSLRFFDITDQLGPRVMIGAVSPWLDFELPWSIGSMLWPTWPVCLVLFAAYLTGIPRSVPARKSFDPARRERAAAISYYTCAPLAMLLLLALAMTAVQMMNVGPWRRIPWRRELTGIATSFAIIFYALTLITFPMRVGGWARRINHSGIGGAVLAAIHVIALVLFGVFAMFILLPWTIGFVWIVFNGLG